MSLVTFRLLSKLTWLAAFDTLNSRGHECLQVFVASSLLPKATVERNGMEEEAIEDDSSGMAEDQSGTTNQIMPLNCHASGVSLTFLPAISRSHAQVDNSHAQVDNSHALL